MKQIVNIENWNRREEYLFFRNFLSPLIAVTVETDCTKARETAKTQGLPLSLYYLHAALAAANGMEEFRYREEDGQVVIYDRIDLFTPILTQENSYRSVRLPYHEDFRDFLKEAQPIVERAKTGEGQAHGEGEKRKDLLLISVNPWYRFTSIQLSVPRDPHETIPLLTFGKITLENGRWLMPVSLRVNHGFVDGFHIGRFLDRFQHLLDR